MQPSPFSLVKKCIVKQHQTKIRTEIILLTRFKHIPEDQIPSAFLASWTSF